MNVTDQCTRAWGHYFPKNTLKLRGAKTFKKQKAIIVSMDIHLFLFILFFFGGGEHKETPGPTHNKALHPLPPISEAFTKALTIS